MNNFSNGESVISPGGKLQVKIPGSYCRKSLCTSLPEASAPVMQVYFRQLPVE
jgi:hypothetical protein